MDNQSIHTEAQPGKGAAGNQWAVQMAQTIAVNAPDAEIPSNVDEELNRHQIEAEIEQEAGTDLKTTDGYVIDESGRIDNFAVEPPMYIEEHGQRIELD